MGKKVEERCHTKTHQVKQDRQTEINVRWAQSTSLIERTILRIGVASVKPPGEAGVEDLERRRGWCRRGLIDVFEASQAGFSKEILRKEVIQPQVPLRLPCYDLVPITGFIFGACLSAPTTSDAPRFGGLTGGVYKAQEHIHRRSADRRLLAIPASCGRVAARNPNWGTIFAISAALRPGNALSVPL